MRHPAGKAVIFYGQADYRQGESGEVVEFYPARKGAEGALRDVLMDEPDLAGELGVIALELPVSPN
jgi:hypothetical protein